MFAMTTLNVMKDDFDCRMLFRGTKTSQPARMEGGRVS